MYNLHSLFADALPDSWGRKVQDAEFQKIGMHDVSALERLSFIGDYGIGAFQFKPQQSFPTGLQAVELAQLRKASQYIITGDINGIVEQLFRAGGLAGGARPKYLVDMKNDGSNFIRYTTGELEEGWTSIILKVAEKNGDLWQRIEYCYFKMAEIAGNFDIRERRTIVNKVKEALGYWRGIANQYKVPKRQIDIIHERISENLNRV